MPMCWKARAFVAVRMVSPITPGSTSRGVCITRPYPAATGARSSGQGGAIKYTEGRQVQFKQAAAKLPGLDGQPRQTMRALLGGSPEGEQEGLYAELVDQCCGQMLDDDFNELSAGEPRYEEINNFSPSFDFPMGAATTRR